MLAKKSKIATNIERLKNTTLPLGKPFLLEIVWDDVKYEFFIRLRKHSDRIFVFGSGAYDSSKLKPPIFHRHSWINRIDESMIFYNDPTLYLGEINLGWGFGTPNNHYLEKIAKIIEILVKKNDVENKRVYFYGSSSGGFMSLILAGFLRGSMAIVNNPQTIVYNYYKRHVDRLFHVTASHMSWNDIITQFKTRLNAIEFYDSINYLPKIHYLQNIACEHDMNKHFTPFIERFFLGEKGHAGKRISVHLYRDDEKGHNPMDFEQTHEYFIKNGII